LSPSPRSRLATTPCVGAAAPGTTLGNEAQFLKYRWTRTTMICLKNAVLGATSLRATLLKEYRLSLQLS
jgi:hypothetical protein